jgi:hypothetical protein
MLIFAHCSCSESPKENQKNVTQLAVISLCSQEMFYDSECKKETDGFTDRKLGQ